MRKIYFFFLFVLLVSCSPQTRLNRLIERHPELKTRDTIVRIKTIYLPAALVDTSRIMLPGDTFYITKDRLYLKIIRVNDTIKVVGGCKADTITIIDTIYQERIKQVITPAKTRNNLPWITMAIIAGILLVIVIIVKFFK